MKIKIYLCVLLNALSVTAQTNTITTATNLVTAVSDFRKAAEQNNAEAQFRLGDCYYNGQGVETNYAEAVKWFRKAAEQNYAKAQDNLGLAYVRGQGVETNYAEAVKWFRKAADQNYAPAQFNLSVSYEYGESMAKNYVEAYRWNNLAAAQGNINAIKNRGEIASKMTPAQIAESLPISSQNRVNAIAQAKQAAVVQLNRYFKTDWSEVNQKTTIRLKDALTTDDGIEFDVICDVSDEKPIPNTILLYITSKSKDWRFLENSRFAIRYDSEKKEFDDLKNKGTVVDRGVIEQMTARFSFDEFRDIAYADSVSAKVGNYIGDYENDFGPQTRQKFRVLFQYFDAIKAEKSVTPEQWAAAKQFNEKKRQDIRQKTQAIALKYNQDLANKGDAYGQLRMGERYLIGDGVETNKALAIEWLNKSSANGNTDASNILAKLSASSAVDEKTKP